MDGTILSQGTFTAGATIVNQIVQIPSNADWMKVYNYTQYGNIGTPASATGIEFYWQRGMAVGTGLVYYGTNGVKTLSGDSLVSGGFTLYDPSGQSGSYAAPILGPAVATTATTNALRPVVSTASTAGIAVGTVVRMSNTAQTDVNGIDMVVGAVTTNTNFTLLTATNPLANGATPPPGVIGGAGFYRIVNVDSAFYPRKRVITNITQAANAQVSTAVAHGLTAGQAVRFLIPALPAAPNGTSMTQLNSSNGSYSIVLSVVDAYNFTINTNTTNYTAFAYPLYSQTPCSFPEVTPVGEDTATSLTTTGIQVPGTPGLQIPNTNTGLLADSTVNTLYLGMILGTGGNGTSLTTAITGPAGSVAADVMYWVAGKSVYGGL